MTASLTVGRLVGILEIDDNRWGSRLNKADDALERATRKADQHLAGVERSLRQTSTAATAAGKTLSESMQKAADKVAIAQTRLTRAHELEAAALKEVIDASDAVDFARIGGDTDKLTAAQKRLDAALRGVTKTMRESAAAGKALATVQKEFEEAGEDAGKALAKGASSTLARLGPALAPAAAVGGAAAAEGFVLAFGVGLIGAGVAAGKQFAHVDQEYAELGERIAKRSKTIFEPYGQSLIDIRHQTEATFEGFAPALDRSADRLAPALTRFTTNVSKALLNLEPAIDPVSRAAEKVLDSLGGRLPSVTAKLERGMHSLADSIEENPEALADLVDGAGSAAEAILKLIAAINKMYGPTRDAVSWLQDLNDWIIEITGQDDTLKWDQGLNETEEAAKTATEALDKHRQSADELKAAQERAAEAAEKHADRLRDLTDATYGQLGADIALREAIDASDDSLREYNEAVAEHGRRSEEASDALRDLESASLRVAEAAFENSLAQQTAAGKAHDLEAANIAARDALLAMASTARGPARDAIMAQVAELNQLIARLYAIPGTYLAKVQVQVSQTGHYSGPPIGAMPKFARGGSIRPGEIGQVAESEPEVLNTGSKAYLLMPPNQGGYITPASDLARSGGGAVGGTATSGGRVVALRAGDDVSRWMLDTLRKAVGDRGGNVQFVIGS